MRPTSLSGRGRAAPAGPKQRAANSNGGEVGGSNGGEQQLRRASRLQFPRLLFRGAIHAAKAISSACSKQGASTSTVSSLCLPINARAIGEATCAAILSSFALRSHRPHLASGRPIRSNCPICDERFPHPIPNDFVEAGGLMSYGTDIPDMLSQVGVYTGQILKGVNPGARVPTIFG